MTRDDMMTLSEAYFAALDAFDVAALRDVLTEDCVLSIETHGIVHDGRDAIADLFETRWATSEIKAVHHSFSHVADPQIGRIASTFMVTYSGPDAPAPKSNANVFTLRDGRISRIQIYMSGENTVRS